MPFASRQFAFKRYEYNIAQCTLMCLRVAPQTLMQGIWYIFHLEICHGMNMACYRHAFKGQSTLERYIIESSRDLHVATALKPPYLKGKRGG